MTTDYKDVCTRLGISYEETATTDDLKQLIKNQTMTETLLNKLTVAQLQAVASEVYGLTLEATVKADIVAEMLEKITA